MWARRPDLARALYGPIARDRRDEIPPGKGPWYELPVFNHYMGRLAINFLRTHIDMSQRHPDALRMSDEVVEALDLMYDLANDPSLHLTMEFQPGDVQLLLAIRFSMIAPPMKTGMTRTGSGICCGFG